MKSVSKIELFQSLGYGGAPLAMETLLEAEGVSRPDKPNISPTKTRAVKKVLKTHFILVCSRGDCQARAKAIRGTREIVAASSPEHCAICGGSVIQSAVDAMVAACQRAGWRRLAVVGGSPNARIQIEAAVAGRLELRLIDGMASRNRKAAAADLAWADHIVVWGTTQLAHKVSLLYSRDAKTSAVNRRGVEELARHVERIAQESKGRQPAVG